MELHGIITNKCNYFIKLKKH